MPLVRIDMLQGKSEQYRAQVVEIVYRTLLDVLNVPPNDRFQIVTERTQDELIFDPHYLGVHRSDNCIFFQITLNSGRSVELKQRFYRTLSDRLHQVLKVRRKDVFWSFGNGEAQYVLPAQGS